MALYFLSPITEDEYIDKDYVPITDVYAFSEDCLILEPHHVISNDMVVLLCYIQIILIVYTSLTLAVEASF